ncbi:Asp23/Gls24 family envelope stress response protein [Oribacterium sp. oral taxon 078]|uniref:Asp23/Gls24 family envelope stress response protein n=1 Tax=Oribacterium sp. oral taxon 078 TaxID=652706 RepID=UPI0001BCC324
MEEREEKRIHGSYEKNQNGELIIADDVIAIIAGISATEVPGVASMAGGWSGEIIARMGIRDLSKGVKIEVDGEQVSVLLSLNVKYGYSIPEVSADVQEKVAQAIESMTGLRVLDVNIRIAGVVTSEDE